MKQLGKKGADGYWQDRKASWIACRIITAQLSISRYLQRQEARLTVLQKKIALLIFCAAGGAYFIYLLGNALFCPPTLHSSSRVMQMQENAQPPPDKSLSHKELKTFNRPQKQKQ